MKELQQISEIFKEVGQPQNLPIPLPSKFFNSKEEAIKAIKLCFTYFDQSINKDNFVLLSEYIEFANYLTNTEKKGLLLTGNVGVGKTLILKFLIPTIFHRIREPKNLFYYSALDLRAKYEEIKTNRYIILDELGRESEINDFGNIINPVVNIINVAADKNQVLFLGTNLSLEDIYNKYGESCFDRIKKNCKIIEFKSKSLR